MKKILTIAFAILNLTAVFGQFFEGKITYQNYSKSKLPDLKDEEFNSLNGTKQEYYIKGGKYKSITNSHHTNWQVYNQADNKIYNKLTYSESIITNEACENQDKIISFKINKNVIEILGYKCDELVLNCKSGTQKYYFNSKLGVDTKLFSNHKYGNWYEYLKHSNAVPLKMIIETEQFIMESIAIEVKPMKLNDKAFELPTSFMAGKSSK